MQGMDMATRLLTAYDPINMPLNRYPNVPAPDHTRVTIQPLPGAEVQSDYVNANYVTCGSHVYIAAQAPMSNTEESFWTMIFQKKIPVIVMLTPFQDITMGNYGALTLIDKCSRYFPIDEKSYYHSYPSGLIVQCIKTTTTNFVEIRELLVTLGSEQFTLKHYFYSAWPDGGLPTYLPDFLLLSDVVTVNPGCLVHCSAGVGRTGLLLAFVFFRLLGKKEADDLLSIVIDMRKCRPLMLASRDQYEYVKILANLYLIKNEQPAIV